MSSKTFGARTILQSADLAFLTLGPVVALILSMLLDVSTEAKSTRVGDWVLEMAPTFFLYTALTQGHVLLIFQRTLFNQSVFQTHRRKIMIGTPLVFLICMLSSWGFLGLALINVFWLQYHFMMQNFGVARMLGSPELIQEKNLRRLEMLFVSLTFFLPPFLVKPDFLFNPNDINLMLLGLNADFAIGPLMNVLSFMVGLAAWLKYPALIFSAAFLIYLWRIEKREKFVFLLSYALIFWIGWTMLRPVIAIIASVILHSVQYYYLVARSHKEMSWLRLSLLTLLMLILAFLFGTLYPVFGSENIVDRSLSFQGRWIWAITIAVNTLHFWMDGFAWKRPVSQ